MRECSVEWCQSQHFALGFCHRHYSQMRAHGEIYRSRSDPNEATIHEDICTIQTYHRNNTPNVCFIVDTEDYELVIQYKWYVKNNHGFLRVLNTNIGYLSRFLLKVNDLKIQVDHINHDTLDHRKSNLRVCTHSENQQNTQANRKNNTSGYKGVYRSRNRWVAAIKVNGVARRLGSYNTKEEAALAYNNAAIKLHGEFAYLSKIPSSTETNPS
jgi:hypothetical protein